MLKSDHSIDIIKFIYDNKMMEGSLELFIFILDNSESCHKQPFLHDLCAVDSALSIASQSNSTHLSPQESQALVRSLCDREGGAKNHSEDCQNHNYLNAMEWLLKNNITEFRNYDRNFRLFFVEKILKKDNIEMFTVLMRNNFLTSLDFDMTKKLTDDNLLYKLALLYKTI